MSFLARSTLRIGSRAAFAPRAFSTSVIYHKSATETVKESVKTIDRAVADKLVDGIELGQQATQKVKDAAGMSTSEVEGKASEFTGEAKGKASEFAGEAKGKVNELAGEARGKKEEIKGKM